MPESFTLKIVTPEKTAFSEEVVSVVAPGVDGYFGVLAHHAPMLAEVGIGRLVAERPSGQEDVLAVAGGFMEVRDNTATILADAAEVPTEIDAARAEEAAERAERRLTSGEHIDIARAEAALARARNRLEIAARR